MRGNCPILCFWKLQGLLCWHRRWSQRGRCVYLWMRCYHGQGGLPIHGWSRRPLGSIWIEWMIGLVKLLGRWCQRSKMKCCRCTWLLQVVSWCRRIYWWWWWQWWWGKSCCLQTTWSRIFRWWPPHPCCQNIRPTAPWLWIVRHGRWGWWWRCWRCWSCCYVFQRRVVCITERNEFWGILSSSLSTFSRWGWACPILDVW